jgi:hypothetical protein
MIQPGDTVRRTAYHYRHIIGKVTRVWDKKGREVATISWKEPVKGQTKYTTVQLKGLSKI